MNLSKLKHINHPRAASKALIAKWTSGNHFTTMSDDDNINLYREMLIESQETKTFIK